MRIFLDAFADRLDRVDAVGARPPSLPRRVGAAKRDSPELCSIRSDLLAGPATAFVIRAKANPPTKRRCGTARPRSAKCGTSIEMTMQGLRRVYVGLGFSGTRSALLAEATVTWRRRLADGRGLDCFCLIRRTLPRKVAQFRSRCAILRRRARSRRIRAVALSDIDDEIPILPADGLVAAARVWN